jgi:predicted HAD superfamily phosphohydrolase
MDRGKRLYTLKSLQITRGLDLYRPLDEIFNKVLKTKIGHSIDRVRIIDECLGKSISTELIRFFSRRRIK